MKYLFEKLRLLSVGALALSFLMAVTLSSCGTGASESDADEDTTEAVDEASSEDEHPASEHPSEEHPSNDSEEHPSDSTATEGDDADA